MSEMNNKPRTWFAGDSSPEDQKKAQETKIIVIALFVLAFPGAALTAGVFFLLFSVARISHKVLFSVALAYTLIISATGLIVGAVKNYVASYANMFSGINENGFSVTLVFNLLWEQAPLSLVVGSLVGSIYCWWRYFRRPAWEKVRFRRTPLEFYRRRKNISEIQNDKNGPNDGMTLGIDDHTGHKKVQTFKEAAAHTFVVGGAGTGKSVTMLTRARDVIENGRAYVMLDLKGSPPMAQSLYELAERYNRPFYHFTLASPGDAGATPDPNGPSFYEPVYRGDASRRKDLIISLRSTWSEEHYKILASEYLQTAMNVAIANPPLDESDVLLDIINLLDPQVLLIRSQGIKSDYPDALRIKEAAQKLAGASRRETADAVRGIRGIVSSLRDSTAGNWLKRTSDESKQIDLYRAAEEGAVVVFTLDTSTYEEVAKGIANLVIQDMKTVSSEMRLRPPAHALHFDIDEFSALDGAHVINLVNKCRDADIPVTLTTQALGDLDKISPVFKDQLVGIIANFIIHRANSEEDAKFYAGLTGVGKRWDVRYSVEQTSSSILGGVGKGAATGAGMVNEIEDYNVPHGEILKLEQGQIIYVGKSPNRLEKVRVIKEDNNFIASSPSKIGATPLQRPSLPSSDNVFIESAPKIESITSPKQYQITGGKDKLNPGMSEPEINFPTKRSSGFVGGVDLNAALRGTPSQQPSKPMEALEAPSPPLRAAQPPEASPKPVTQQSQPSVTPVRPLGRTGGIPTRPVRPSAPTGGIPSRPTSPPTVKTSVPSADTAMTAGSTSAPIAPVTPATRPVPAKKKAPDAKKHSLSEEW